MLDVSYGGNLAEDGRATRVSGAVVKKRETSYMSAHPLIQHPRWFTVFERMTSNSTSSLVYLRMTMTVLIDTGRGVYC